MATDRNNFTIGKLAAKAAVGIETVRFYQRSGLIGVPPKQGGVRYYDDEYVRTLGFIKKAKQAGFTLQEIKRLLELDASEDRSEARALAQLRLQHIEKQLAELKAAQSALKKLAHACEHGKSGPCPIIASFA